ncbi:hypothetical protein Nepgr_000962 [Nepenthes gracilis]|uniref:Uncharacterized protein n=1 Tax=Nepenthes gracilis TaxID=150966 RepID=A0AAD3P673_NEPGR|nr:hypothetical protein Nepgr_000962 [Nepenthes gracilis]
MEEFGSKSSREGVMQLDYYYHGNRPTFHDLRSYSIGPSQQRNQLSYDYKLKKTKTISGSSSSSSFSKVWCFSDPEFQRKKRVASYKIYSAEGKVKGSFRKSFKWLKDRYTRVVYGW